MNLSDIQNPKYAVGTEVFYVAIVYNGSFSPRTHHILKGKITSITILAENRLVNSYGIDGGEKQNNYVPENNIFSDYDRAIKKYKEIINESIIGSIYSQSIRDINNYIEEDVKNKVKSKFIKIYESDNPFRTNESPKTFLIPLKNKPEKFLDKVSRWIM